MALKMSKISNYMTQYKQKLRVAQMSQNRAMMKQAQN